MTFLLSYNNVFNYLAQVDLCEVIQQKTSQVETRTCKNFNLLVHLPEGRDLLVKQEPHDRQGEAKGDLWHEWRVHQLLQAHTELAPLREFFSEVVHFDPDSAIVVTRYLRDYCDLDEFYSQNCRFSPAIAAQIGHAIAIVHQATLDRSDYRSFLTEDEPPEAIPDLHLHPDLHLNIELTPALFGQVSEEGLKFYALYQRYESLNRAIDQLQQSQESCCLTHQDLKFNNILLHQPWQQDEFPPISPNSPSPIRLIDWEKWSWGDPAADLGTLVAGYLKIWLKSLGLRSGLDINLALRWAGVPLEELQPSMIALIQAYLAAFPAILARFPQFLPRTMQFTGLALIESLQAKLHYREPFGNTEIGMLQVAKTLLCSPEQSIATVLGISADDLMQSPRPIPASLPFAIASVGIANAENSLSESSSLPLSEYPPSEYPPLEYPLLTATQAQMLQDLVQHIQIRSDGLSHRHSFPAARELQHRLQRLPIDQQRHYLRTQLGNLLYDLYCSGELKLAAIQSGTVQLENNAVGGLNLQFFEQIQRSNTGTGYWDGGWQVQQAFSGRYAVQKAGLTIFVEPQHLRPESRSPQIGETIEILLPNHRMEGDFYVAVGNAGLPPEDRPTLEVCFHVAPIGALALMRHCTDELNQRQMPFRLKMITNPEEDGRYDAAVLYLECQFYPVLRIMLSTIYAEIRSHFYPAVPLMMKPIAPGIGLAEEPDGEPFGIHRCQIIADALLTVEQQADSEGETIATMAEKRLTAIQQHFLQQGLDWQFPYLNGKEDCYEPIDV